MFGNSLTLKKRHGAKKLAQMRFRIVTDKDELLSSKIVGRDICAFKSVMAVQRYFFGEIR